MQNLFGNQLAFGSLCVKINYTPKMEEKIALVLLNREVDNIDQWMGYLASESKMKSMLKKGEHYLRLYMLQTSLKNIKPGSYDGYLFTLLKDEKGESKECRKKKIKVSANLMSTIEFNIVNEEACVNFVVKERDDFIIGAEVMIEGLPNALTSKGSKETVVYLKQGKYKVSVLGVRKKLETYLEVKDLEDQFVTFDLSSAS